MEKDFNGRVLIECPNTLFYLYVENEDELSKIDIFMNNIKTVKKVKLDDIYNWCNRQGIVYDTKFNFNKNFSLVKTVLSYWDYTKLKLQYQ